MRREWGGQEELGISLTRLTIDDNTWYNFGITDMEFKGYKLCGNAQIIKGEGEKDLCFKIGTQKENLCWQKGNTILTSGSRLMNRVKISSPVHLKDLKFKARCLSEDGEKCFERPYSDWDFFVIFADESGLGTQWQHDVTKLQKQ